MSNIQEPNSENQEQDDIQAVLNGSKPLTKSVVLEMWANECKKLGMNVRIKSPEECIANSNEIEVTFFKKRPDKNNR